jgi:hypothetical protein
MSDLRSGAWRRVAAVLAALVVGLSGAFAAGCGDDNEGPVEEAGKAVDEAGQEAGQALDDADESIGDDENDKK